MTSAGGSNGYENGNNGYGVIFSFDPSTSTYTKLKDFDYSNGANPTGSLILASDGKLYGMTNNGGSNDNGESSGYGVIFSFDPSSSTYTKLHDFDGANGANPSGSLMQAKDGKLYGMTYGRGTSEFGVIFSFDPSSSTYTKLKDFDKTNGAGPSGSLMQASDGKLYGMTVAGGSSDEGVIFSFDPTFSTYTKLKDFNGTNGAYPRGSLMQARDGKLYGMTQQGGSAGYGVIFSFDPSSSTYTKLKDFDGANGAGPQGSLMQARDGKLYGMTNNGGSGYGVIFSYDLSSSTYTKLKDFNDTNGANPEGSLIEASDGKLYGMTSEGGSRGYEYYNNGYGVIFSFDPSSSTYKKLKDFASNETGSNVAASLIQARDGKLYGMTTNGGSKGLGVIFSLDPSSSTYTKLKDFDGINGARPYGGLMQARDGKLYGMTSEGGSSYNYEYQYSGYGVIFSFDPSSSTYTKLHDFDYTNGANPSGSLVQANDGKLYGVTSGGGSDQDFPFGVMFSFDPTSLTFTKLKDFDYSDPYSGLSPVGNLIWASDEKLYGMTSEGGSNYKGVIFSFDPSTSTYKKLKDFDGINGAPSLWRPYAGKRWKVIWHDDLWRKRL
jgi:uncharacterized repeat protein (TIGR03803 family)